MHKLFCFDIRDAQHGPEYDAVANSIMEDANYWTTDDGTEHYHINGYRVSQSHDGLVKITSLSNRTLIRTSPSNGSVTITTPYFHCTASLRETSHLFVR